MDTNCYCNRFKVALFGEKCPENSFIFNDKCLLNCEEEKIPKENECLCKYNYYKNNSKLNCLFENENCPSNFPFLNTETKECIIECPSHLLTFINECVKNCPENFFVFNSTCVENCPLKYYYKTNKKIYEISDCLERDLDDNIYFYIHENSYEEFLGKNTCHNNNNNYKFFIAEIYDSNYIFNKNDNTKSKLNTSECEKILKNNYNIPENECLTIFKIDYYYENLVTPKMDYKIFYKSQKLNLTLCENVSLDITTPANFENSGIDMNLLNSTLDSGIDIFNLSSEFFNDICSTFSSGNGTDVPIKDRQKDYYQNISLCQEGCVYNGFDRSTNTINCNCNSNNNISEINSQVKHKSFGNVIFKLISNSNLKVLKCFYLCKNFKNLLKNYGNYIFIFCEIGEIILFFIFLFNGIFPLMKNFKNIRKEIYFKTNKNKTLKNPPKKKYQIENSIISNEILDKSSFDLKLNNNIIIYNDIGVYKGNILNKNKEKKYSQKKYQNEEINDLNYNESLLIDQRNFLLMYYNFLQYSQLIIFTFITKTDFNLKTIKISLFLFSFVIYLTFNTLFFTDETMSQIYKKGGSFDFIYNLPKIFFSSLCCSIINFLLKYLSLSQNDIKMLNSIKNEKEKNIKIRKIMKCWKYKIFAFYFLIFLFMSLFHIYVISFCSVYVNTQKHLIKSTLISFILSMIYPFGICLVTTFFRKMGLKFKNKFLFNCSKIMQLY